jgi:intein/homing endonuclease
VIAVPSSGTVAPPLFNTACWYLGFCEFYHMSVSGDRVTIVKINGEVRTVTFEELFNMFADRAVKNGDADVIPAEDLDIYALSPVAVVRNPEFYMTEKELAMYRAYLMGGLSKLALERQLGISRGMLDSAIRKAQSDLYVVVGGWSKVKYIIRHKCTKKMYRVATKYGETVVTEDHSLLALKGGKLVEVKPIEAKATPPARLHVLDVGHPVDVVDLWKYIGGGKGYVVKCRKCGYEWVSPAEERERRCSRCGSKMVEAVNTVDYSDGFYLDGDLIKHVRSSFSIPRYVTGEVLRNLLRLIAAYVSEGFLVDERRGARGRIEISNKDVEWLRQLERCAKSLGNVTTQIVYKRDHRDEKYSVYNLVIHSTPLKKIFEKLCGRHAENKRLPDFVLMLSREYIEVLLSDMVKGDGYREHREKYTEEYRGKHFRYFSKSRRLIAQLSFILSRLGMKYSIWYNTRTGIYTVAVNTKYWADSRSKAVVEEVPAPEYVYDLEVEGSHAFVDGVGLITLHNTAYYILPPGLDVVIHWAPEEDNKVQVIFALTFGTPRDYNTGEVVYTGDVGFWHRGKGMKLHWDPIVESIVNFVYPHITPTTKQDYFEIRFINRTSRTIIVDVSIWIFEYTVHNYQMFLSMVRGFSKLLRLVDAVLPDNIDRETALKIIAELFREAKPG